MSSGCNDFSVAKDKNPGSVLDRAKAVRDDEHGPAFGELLERGLDFCAHVAAFTYATIFLQCALG